MAILKSLCIYDVDTTVNNNVNSANVIDNTTTTL